MTADMRTAHRKFNISDRLKHYGEYFLAQITDIAGKQRTQPSNKTCPTIIIIYCVAFWS